MVRPTRRLHFTCGHIVAAVETSGAPTAHAEPPVCCTGDAVTFHLDFSPRCSDMEARYCMTLSALQPAPPPRDSDVPHRDQKYSTYKATSNGVEHVDWPEHGSTHSLGVLDEQGRTMFSARNLPRPGFWQVRVTAGESDKMAFGAVAVDPHLLRPGLPPPDDFDTFWQTQKARLARVPRNVRMSPVAVDRQGVDAFDVRADVCTGVAGISAYLAKPSGSAPGSLPAILVLHGAGVRSSELHYPFHFANYRSTLDWAAGGNWTPPHSPTIERWHPDAAGAGGAGNGAGALSMNLNAHGLPNGRTSKYYEALNSGIKGQYDPQFGALTDYRTRGWQDRHQNYFLGMFLRMLRAIDVLTTQPEWDGRTLVVLGSSQGGAQAIAAAGLDHRVSFVAAAQPGLCDHGGPLASPRPRVGGWPHILQAAEDHYGSKGKLMNKVAEEARYFDCANFATRWNLAVQSQWSVGFCDIACPPSSVYAAFNSVPACDNGSHAMHHDRNARHENTLEAASALQAAILAHFAASGHT